MSRISFLPSCIEKGHRLSHEQRETWQRYVVQALCNAYHAHVEDAEDTTLPADPGCEGWPPMHVYGRQFHLTVTRPYDPILQNPQPRARQCSGSADNTDKLVLKELTAIHLLFVRAGSIM